ncbi:Subtilisin DY [Chlamydia trachomatis]|nr:Subtilisin DY [Chlamydia trachomatis]
MVARLRTLSVFLMSLLTSVLLMPSASAADVAKVAILDSGVALEAAVHYDAITATDGTVDEFGHGTMVAGILLDNLPNSLRIDYYDIKVLDGQGRGTAESICNGLHSAGEFGVDIAVMSLGFYREPDNLRACVDRALASGITIIAAVGDNVGAHSNYPAAYPGVLAIAAHDQEGHLYSFSSLGKIDYAELGVDVVGREASGATQLVSGSSFAAPRFAAKLLSHRNEGTAHWQNPAPYVNGEVSLPNGESVPTIDFAEPQRTRPHERSWLFSLSSTLSSLAEFLSTLTGTKLASVYY